MILVTGGLGMIGAHTARALADLGHDVVVTAHRTTTRPSFLPASVVVEPVDVTDPAAVLALSDRHRVTGVVHLAGSVPGRDPVAFYRRDLAGLLAVLDAARAWGVGRCAVASSLGSYVGRAEVPWREDLDLPGVPAPHPIIALKKAVEPLCLTALEGTGVQPVVLRIGSTWGPLMDPESAFNAVPPLVSAALRGDRPVALASGTGGDFCYAPDAGRAIALLMTAERLAHTTVNVSSGVPFTARELAGAVEAAVPGAQVEVQGPDPDAPAPYLDITRLATATGFRPHYGLADAIANYVAWRRRHPR